MKNGQCINLLNKSAMGEFNTWVCLSVLYWLISLSERWSVKFLSEHIKGSQFNNKGFS